MLQPVRVPLKEKQAEEEMVMEGLPELLRVPLGQAEVVLSTVGSREPLRKAEELAAGLLEAEVLRERPLLGEGASWEPEAVRVAPLLPVPAELAEKELLAEELLQAEGLRLPELLRVPVGLPVELPQLLAQELTERLAEAVATELREVLPLELAEALPVALPVAQPEPLPLLVAEPVMLAVEHWEPRPVGEVLGLTLP